MSWWRGLSEGGKIAVVVAILGGFFTIAAAFLNSPPSVIVQLPNNPTSTINTAPIATSTTTIPATPTVAPSPTTAPATPTVAPSPTTAPATPTVAPSPTTAPATPKPLPEPIGGILEINQAIKTYPEQLNTTLKSIEILPTGVMRWHFEFWNKAADSVSVRTLPQSYVVDNLGNRYALTSGFDLAIQPGVRVEDKADFEAPKAGANAFTLHLLNGYIGSGFEEPALTVSAVLNKSN